MIKMSDGIHALYQDRDFEDVCEELKRINPPSHGVWSTGYADLSKKHRKIVFWSGQQSIAVEKLQTEAQAKNLEMPSILSGGEAPEKHATTTQRIRTLNCR